MHQTWSRLIRNDQTGQPVRTPDPGARGTAAAWR
jgi:hypothetical protein